MPSYAAGTLASQCSAVWRQQLLQAKPLAKSRRSPLSTTSRRPLQRHCKLRPASLDPPLQLHPQDSTEGWVCPRAGVMSHLPSSRRLQPPIPLPGPHLSSPTLLEGATKPRHPKHAPQWRLLAACLKLEHEVPTPSQECHQRQLQFRPLFPQEEQEAAGEVLRTQGEYGHQLGSCPSRDSHRCS